jgi:FkbM family methyltransferase
MKQLIQKILGRFGYRLTSLRKIGSEPWQDVQILLEGKPSPLFFDVGAHRGETLAGMAQQFPGAVIHSFEPDPENFAKLQQVAGQFPHARVHPLALGDQAGTSKLVCNSFSMTNSLLEAGADSKGDAFRKVGEVAVTVTTIDEFCRAHQITDIDFLKTDCQGFDLRVLKGAAGLLAQQRINLIMCEGIFDAEYVGQGWFYEILQYLTSLGYAPVSFHGLTRNSAHEINWGDVLFKKRQTR